MAILPLGAKPQTFTIGGSPRGWTFLSTAACWLRFGLRYGIGYFPVAVKDYFDLGSAYHALMEGQDVDKVRKEFPNHIAEAMRLRAIRMSKGPPLGSALAVEREYALFGGLMTSKPDREEPGQIRDYKTAMMMSADDEAHWNTNGGIIGEAVASNVSRALVDIVSKREGKGEHNATEKPVKVVVVNVTERHKARLEAHVREFWEQLETRVTRAAKPKADAVQLFPPNLNECVGDYGPCDYYAYCWGKPPESMMYRMAPEAPRRWVTGREGAPLKLPGKLTAKLIDTAFAKLRQQLFKEK